MLQYGTACKLSLVMTTPLNCSSAPSVGWARNVKLVAETRTIKRA